MGNLVYYNINHQYKCQSIFILYVQCGRRYNHSLIRIFKRKLLNHVDCSLFFAQLYVTLSDVDIQIKMKRNFNFTFLYYSVSSSIVPALQMWAVAIYGPCV